MCNQIQCSLYDESFAEALYLCFVYFLLGSSTKYVHSISGIRKRRHCIRYDNSFYDVRRGFGQRNFLRDNTGVFRPDGYVNICYNLFQLTMNSVFIWCQFIGIFWAYMSLPSIKFLQQLINLVAFSFSIKLFPNTYLKTKGYHTYIIINASNEEICFEFKRKQRHNIGFPTFKLTASTKIPFWLTR